MLNAGKDSVTRFPRMSALCSRKLLECVVHFLEFVINGPSLFVHYDLMECKPLIMFSKSSRYFFSLRLTIRAVSRSISA